MDEEPTLSLREESSQQLQTPLLLNPDSVLCEYVHVLGSWSVFRQKYRVF